MNDITIRKLIAKKSDGQVTNENIRELISITIRTICVSGSTITNTCDKICIPIAMKTRDEKKKMRRLGFATD